MGNQKNARRRIPTAKKSAAYDSNSPPRAVSRVPPKPKPTRKEVEDRHSVTWADQDVGMVDCAEDEDEDEYEYHSEDYHDNEDERLKQHIAAAAAEKEKFKIPFEVSVSGRYKELPIPLDSTWEEAQILIGRKMLRVPESLSLGYINPFKSSRGSGKIVPSSLENEEEWNGLLHHVKTFLEHEKAKNKGKGGVSKPWTIILVDLAKDAQATSGPGRIASKNTARNSKTKQADGGKRSDDHDNHDDTSDSGTNSHTLAEICRRHHCDRCQKACYIDPGPPPVHKPFTMEQLSVWTSLVGLKAATIDQVPEALRIPKRRDREPLPPASGPQAVTKAPSHVENTTTNNAAVANSQSYLPSHPGFANIQGFPSFPAPTFPMPPYAMPPYSMPAPMYTPPYGYPFAPQGQPNGFPAPFMMQNYTPMPNYPMPAPIFAPAPSGYPFSMPPPPSQGANLNRNFRKRQFSVSECQPEPEANVDPLDEVGTLNTDPSLGPVPEWITTPDTPAPGF